MPDTQRGSAPAEPPGDAPDIPAKDPVPLAEVERLLALTEDEEEVVRKEYGRRLTRRLLRGPREDKGLSHRKVAERRGVSVNAITTLEGQDIATIKIGTVVKQLNALGYEDVDETIIVKLILDFIQNPDQRRVS